MSSAVNSVNIIGRLGRDPEMRYTPSGKPVTNMNVAINERFGDDERTTWIRVVTWNATAFRGPPPPPREGEAPLPVVPASSPGHVCAPILRRHPPHPAHRPTNRAPGTPKLASTMPPAASLRQAQGRLWRRSGAAFGGLGDDRGPSRRDGRRHRKWWP